MKPFPYDVSKASRKEFWRKLIQSMNEKSSLCRNISPSNRHWIRAGLYGMGLTFMATGYCGRAELYIDRRDRKENKFIYDTLMSLPAALKPRDRTTYLMRENGTQCENLWCAVC